jgi:hypothetical protein
MEKWIGLGNHWRTFIIIDTYGVFGAGGVLCGGKTSITN